MVIRIVGIVFVKFLVYGGIVLFVGLVGKGYLVDWVYLLFWD